MFTSIDSPDVAIEQLKAGQLDLFAETVSNPENFKVVKEDPNLRYYTSLGTYTELTFNPILNFKDGRLNPFGDPQIREAMNMLVDRNYIVQEIYGGLAVPKLLPMSSSFPDYARYIDTARALENIYAYNPEKAKAIIKERMEALGATLGAEGKWQYNGQPVTLIFIIRIEDERKAIGDYVAGVLEEAGFTVDRQYKSRQEASPIWVRSDPAEGQWNFYTGGWITTAVSRDDGGNFAYFYTKLGSGSPLWQAYTPSEEFFSVAEDLWTNNFKTMEERGQLFRKAMELALKDSVRVWLVDQVSFSPARANVQVAADLAGGVSGSRLWPYTISFVGQGSDTIRIAVNGIPVEPWNPLGGSNWISDQMAIRATADTALMPDPYTGLVWPQRIEKAEVVAKEGLPISKSLDWVDLKFVAEIPVPDDAWADWDATNQKFVTVGEMKAQIADAKAKQGQYNAKVDELVKAVDYKAFKADAVKQVMSDLATFLKDLTGQEIDVEKFVSSEDGKAAVDELVTTVKGAATDEEKQKALSAFLQEHVAFDAKLAALTERNVATANVKTTVYYPADLFKKVKWHDGAPLTLGDFIVGMILAFDPGKPESAIFDEAAASNLESFLSHFKGVRIVSTDPLTIETYDDYYLLDAELTVSTWWPSYSYGQSPWHVLALGIQAEAENKLAFSADKAQANSVDQTSYIGGPSLEILKGYLDQDAQSGYVPYAATLGQYVTADEAKARYANLQKWFGEHNHFWVGTGPFYLDKVFTTEKSVVLKRFADFPDPADKWARFGEPKIATVAVDGPAQVKAGEEAKFDVSVTFKGQPYPASELASVKYLLFDANNNLVAKGDATFVADGKYQVVLSADVTKGLAAGTNKLEVVVASKVVSIPAFQSIQFVTAP